MQLFVWNNRQINTLQVTLSHNTLLMKKALLIFLLINAPFLPFAQSVRMMHWYFGQNAGINFTSGQPVVVTDGQLKSWENTTSISDLNGDLLFYTNGRTVWNRNHDTLENGFMLYGDESALKGVLAVPLPGSQHEYHLLTTAGAFLYHTIDMNLDNGLGAVVLKNQEVLPRTTESLAGTLHCNKNDYWIVARSWNPDDVFLNDTMHFYVSLLSSNGLSTPVRQTFYLDTRYKTLYDHPTFSPSGKLFSYSSLSSNVYLFDFDTYSGTLAFKDSIRFNTVDSDSLVEKVYSTEFSPDETKLYVTYWKKTIGWTYIAQFDLTAPDITASKVILDSIPIPPGIQYAWGTLGRIQLAPDGKIYASRYRSVGQYFVRDTLDAILYPNQNGLAATYQRDFLPLNGAPTTCGLPGFISNFSQEDIGQPDCPSVADVNTIPLIAFSVFPNPAESGCTIQLMGNNNKACRVFLSDLSGRIRLEEMTNKAGSVYLNTKELASGIYTVVVEYEGQIQRTAKLIVQ